MEISGIWAFFQGPIYGVSLVGHLKEMKDSHASKWANPTPRNKASRDAQSEKHMYAKRRSDEAFNYLNNRKRLHILLIILSSPTKPSSFL